MNHRSARLREWAGKEPRPPAKVSGVQVLAVVASRARPEAAGAVRFRAAVADALVDRLVASALARVSPGPAHAPFLPCSIGATPPSSMMNVGQGRSHGCLCASLPRASNSISTPDLYFQTGDVVWPPAYGRVMIPPPKNGEFLRVTRTFGLNAPERCVCVTEWQKTGTRKRSVSPATLFAAAAHQPAQRPWRGCPCPGTRSSSPAVLRG